ncbi:MAG: DeoR/GlpR family DNA-binding transcription regulator [Micropruina sp.]|uniref:DeoR/GlpR family DNA-binding transcription regulator n=1 Tax=Micropruina sp. TaxID=2737536 RepID=UPI0039E69FB3
MQEPSAAFTSPREQLEDPPAKASKGQRRRQKILQLLTTEPDANVSVSDLSDRFGVSVATIRRDLADLQDRRLVTRTYGGAALQHQPRTELTMRERVSAHAEAKQAIGRAAAELIEDGDLIILDSGSTTEQLAVAIGNRPVSVITNGLRVANQLVPQDQVRVTVLGGSLRGINETITGSDAESMLNRVEATYAFIGTDAVDPVRGITSRTYEQARLKAAMLRNSQRTYLVADSSKLGEHGLFHYWSELPSEWGLVTDEDADPAVLAQLRAAGACSIIIAPLSSTEENW